MTTYWRWRSTHETWYCTAGHPRCYAGESDLEREKRLRSAAEQQAQDERDRVTRRDRVIRAMRGHATRLRRRAACGVCPCCKRSFVELARHMKTQHPGYAKQDLG